MRDESQANEPPRQPRADDPIRDDVMELLSRDRGVDEVNIEVDVVRGEVLLDGHTCSHRSKQRAERLAELVAGVTAVRNRVRIVVRS